MRKWKCITRSQGKDQEICDFDSQCKQAADSQVWVGLGKDSVNVIKELRVLWFKGFKAVLLIPMGGRDSERGKQRRFQTPILRMAAQHFLVYR